MRYEGGWRNIIRATSNGAGIPMPTMTSQLVLAWKVKGVGSVMFLPDSEIQSKSSLDIARTHVHSPADDTKGVAAEGRVRPAKLRGVRQVERFGTELDFQPFSISEVLCEGDI